LFAKLPKATISFVMSVCVHLSSRMEQLAPTTRKLMKVDV